MRKWITFLMTLLVGSSISYANADSAQVTLEAGYRHDNINWKHKVPSCDPIFKRTTKFEDIDIFQVGLKGRSMLGCNFYVRGAASFGWILDGDFKQSVSTFFRPSFSDFGSLSQDFEFSAHHREVIDDKYVYDLNIAVGYPFYFCDCTLAVSPVIGYAVDAQHLCVEHEGFNFGSFSDGFFPESGSDCCCHKFTNRWYGPFIGVDFTYRPCGECWNLYAQLEYHYARFKARFDHDDFSLFGDNHSHRSRHAHGWVFGLGADYDLSCDWTLGLSVKFQDWKAHRNHRNHCGDSLSSSGFFGSSNFGREKNEHKWHSYAINLTLGKHF